MEDLLRNNPPSTTLPVITTPTTASPIFPPPTILPTFPSEERSELKNEEASQGHDDPSPTPASCDLSTAERKPESSPDASDPPVSKITLRITTISMFTQSHTTKETPKSTSPDASILVLVTAVTLLDPVTQRLLPILVTHHVKTRKPSSSIKSKIVPMMGSGVFTQGPDYIDINDPLPNPVSLSTITRENLSTTNFVNVLPLRDHITCGCGTGCCGAEVSQMVSLNDGRFLALTCNTLCEDSSVNLFLFMVNLDGEVMPDPLSSIRMKCKDLWITPVKDVTSGSGKTMLAGVSSLGKVLVYRCADGVLDQLCSIQCDLEVEDEFTSCTFSSSTGHLFISSRTGKVVSVLLKEKIESEGDPSSVSQSRAVLGGSDHEAAALQLGYNKGSEVVSSSVEDAELDSENLTDGVDSGTVPTEILNSEDLGDKAVPDTLIDSPNLDGTVALLSLKDLDDILNLVHLSSLGVPFSCSSPVHWKKITLLQLNRQSPLHINQPPEHVRSPYYQGHGGRGNKDNSTILQFEPPMEPPTPNRSV